MGVVQHIADVEVRGRKDLRLVKVAGAGEHGAVGLSGHNERRSLDADLAQDAEHLLRLRRLEGQFVDDDELAVGDLTRQSGAYRQALHLLAFRPVRRTFTRTPSLPGTAPLIMRMPFAESERTTLRFFTVACPVPMWPAILTPLITRPGSVPAPMEPGARARSDWPCVFGPPRKPCRFMTPAKPWPFVAPETSTMSPGSKISQPTFLPTSQSPMSSTRSSRR